MEQVEKFVTVTSCVPGCPFFENIEHDENNFPTHVSCSHPKAPDEIPLTENVMRFGAIPETCPLRTYREILTRYKLMVSFQ